MSRGDDRNAGLSRAAITAAAGAGLIGLVQQSMAAPMTDPLGLAAMIGGGALVAAGLALAILTLFRRSRGPDE